MEIDEEFEQAITADVGVIVQQPIVDTAERVEQLADVLLSYAEGKTVGLCTPPSVADHMHTCAPLLHHHDPDPAPTIHDAEQLAGLAGSSLRCTVGPRSIACLTACRTSNRCRFGLAAGSPADAHIHGDPRQQGHRVHSC